MNAASLAAGREIHGVVCDVLWFTVGFAIGGTPSGAVGGGYGALATRARVFVLGELASYGFKKDQEVGTTQKSRGETKLKTVQEIWDKMTSTDAGQITETLTAVTETERTVSHGQTDSDGSEISS